MLFEFFLKQNSLCVKSSGLEFRTQRATMLTKRGSSQSLSKYHKASTGHLRSFSRLRLPWTFFRTDGFESCSPSVRALRRS